jgi:hypothetical protein
VLKNFATKVEAPDQVPNDRHFAILVFKSSTVHVPGDERSRTAPGHGYPAHDVTHQSYEYWAVGDRESLKDAIGFLEECKRERWKEADPYAVVEVRPVRVETKIELKIGS